ncbi:hypothetical protein GCM10027589_04430 [Actinocorallia lasiicapitis]
MLDVAAEVAALMPPEDLAQLEKKAGDGYDCLGCEQRAVLADGPAAVVIQRSGPLTLARLAHRTCRASAVEVLAPGALRARDDVAAVVVAGLWPGVSGHRPVLVIDIPHGLSISAPGDRVDAVVYFFLRLGLHLATSAGRTPPRAAAGWSVRLPSPVEAVVTAPDGSPVYDGDLVRSPMWDDLAASFGGAVLLIGSNLDLASTGPHDPGITRVNAAARAGLLVGGVVPVLV